MNVLITAGGIPHREDSLYELTQGGHKALLPIADKPIIQWIVDAFSGVPGIEYLVIVGLPPQTPIKFNHKIHFLPDKGDLIQNTRSGLDELRRIDPKAEFAIMCAGDIPAITSKMISWMMMQAPALNADVVYTIIERSTMEKTFPESKRTYLHLKDKEVCGGDIISIRLDPRIQEHPIWEKLVGSRKNPLKQASMLGFDTLFRVATRSITIQGLEQKVSGRLGINCRTLLTPYAEMGMDADKLFQFRIVEKFLTERLGQ
jgi:hypothetical protein